MTTAQCTVAEYLAHRLAEMGVKHLFSIPGDFIVPFLQTIDDLGEIQRVGNTNEMEAGYAADGYARIAGVGAIAVTYGVGSLSLINTIAGAYVEQVPLVVICGSPGTDKRLIDRDTGLTWHHMMVNGESRDLAIYRNVTVAAVQISNPARATLDIDAVLSACLAEQLPVYLEMFEDVYTAPCALPSSPLIATPIPSVAANTAAAVTAAATKIRAAIHPLIWAGGELRHAGLAAAVTALVADTGLPFTTSLAGKGVISERNPQFRGVYDGQSSDPTVAALFNDSDCLITLGAWPTDINLLGVVAGELTDTGPWTHAIRALRGSVRVGGAYFPQVALGDFVAGLHHALTGYRAPVSPPPARKAAPAAADGDALTFDNFFGRMATFVDDSHSVIADIGFSSLGAMDLTIGSDAGFVSQAVWASIGYAVPAAIGASYALPSQRPIVFAGDGAFHMTIQAISTMVSLDLNPIIFVMNNGIYGVEQWLIDATVFNPPGDPKRVTPINQLQRWEFSKAPDLFGGGDGYRVTTIGELDQTLTMLRIHTGRLAIVDVRLDELSLPSNTLWKTKPPVATGAKNGAAS